MNGEKITTEAAEMESAKKEAPGRLQPDRGQDETKRQLDITPSSPHLQHKTAGPAQPFAAQRAQLLAMLRRGPVSTLEARAACIMSPASRVFELRKIGLEITTTRLENRIAIYHLIDPPRRPGNDE